MEKVKLVFFVDFDGTITTQDVCHAMVTELAAEGWQEINARWERKELSTLDCARETFQLFKSKEPEALREIADKITIDPEFLEFLKYCKQKDYPVYILSDGYDYYIDYILKREGIALPYYANSLSFSPTIEVEAPYQSKACDLCGVCKTELMIKLLKPGERAIYIGDGASDFCPALEADYVFAKDKLYNYCLSLGRQITKFNSFQDILRELPNLELEVKTRGRFPCLAKNNRVF